MARGKDPVPQSKPKPGRSDRKVIIEYSSDEEEPQQGGDTSKKKVTKQIHLMLPTSPTHMTTTESFKTFFINHGLTKALRKAFEKRGWSTDQMQELMTNFRNKYGQTIPLPKIYRGRRHHGRRRSEYWEMERGSAGRPQVMAEAVVVRVEARAPPQELPKMMAEPAALEERRLEERNWWHWWSWWHRQKVSKQA